MKDLRSFGSAAVLFLVLTSGSGSGVAAESLPTPPEDGLAQVTSELDELPRVGTAFVVGASQTATFLVTAAHVVSGDASPRLRFAASPFEEHPADVVRIDEGFDLAILQVPRRLDGVQALPFASRRARASDPVFALGLPRRAARPRTHTSTVASVEGVRVVLGQGLDPGFSGGPLLGNGQVLGLIQQTEGNQAFGLDAIVLHAFLQGYGIPLGDPDTPTDAAAGDAQRDVSEIAAAGGIDFSGSNVRDSLLIQQPRDSTITVVQGRPKLSLQTDFAYVGLGSTARFTVVSRPAGALEGRACSWTASPPELFVQTDDSVCTLDLEMPVLPLRQQPLQIPIDVSVQILHQGEVEDELSFQGRAYNGLRAEVMLDRSPMARSEKRPVRVVDSRNGADLPPLFSCRWDFSGMPIRVEPEKESTCRGELSFKDPENWGALESQLFKSSATMVQQAWPGSVFIQTTERGQRVGQLSFLVHLEDFRAPADTEIPATDLLLKSILGPLKRRSGFDAELRTLGLPPLAELSEEDLDLRLSLDRRQPGLRLFPATSDSPEAARLFAPYQGRLEVEYSVDGEEPFRRRAADSLESLAEIDEVWVRIRSKISDATAGPFRFDVEFSQLVREAAMDAWKTVSEHHRKDLLCRDLHQGASRWAHLLAVVETVHIRCQGEGLERALSLGSSLEYLWGNELEILRPPVGPCPYQVEVRFFDGSSSLQACTREFSTRQRLPGGRYYRLERKDPEGIAAPAEIEIYLKHRKMRQSTRWSLFVAKELEATHLRLSTDGGSFSTLPLGPRGADEIPFETVEEKGLFLRFVLPDGREVAYAGEVPFQEHQFEIERDELLREAALQCTTDPKLLGEGERTEAGSDSLVFCGLQMNGSSMAISGSGALPFGRLQGVVRAVQVGCTPDTLETEIEVTRQNRRFGPWVLTVEEPCATVYGQMIFEDDSRSEVLVAPVTGG